MLLKDTEDEMMKKICDRIFIGVFCLILFVPFLLAHREEARVSDTENRTLAGLPHVIEEGGGFNVSFPADFDAWINDNARFRTTMMKLNAALQYELFGKVAKDSLREGKEGHLYYVDAGKVQEYQHLNLMSQEDLAVFTDSMQKLSSYFSDRGICFYYMQCFDKDSIYPEYYVEGVNQFGSLSRANQILESLEKNTDVKVIPVYEALMENKGEELLYFKTTDPAHWNEYGAHIGYTALLHTIQKDFPEARCLTEEDYLITRFEGEADIYGFTYPYPENSLRYKIKEPRAVEQNLDEFDPQQVIRYREYGHYFINEASGNDLKIMVVGDSYIRQFLKEHIAEGFGETLSIDWINLTSLDQILEIYQPDLVVFESAEFFLYNTIPLVNEVKYSKAG